jgi:hypothetical protein
MRGNFILPWLLAEIPSFPLLFSLGCTSIHYVRIKNQRHRSEMRPQTIVFDLVKRDTPTSVRRGPGSGEGKKEVLSFAMHLSLFRIRDVPAFVTKMRRAFC